MYLTRVACSERPPQRLVNSESDQPLVTTQRQVVWENAAWRVECNQVRNLETLEDQPAVRIAPAVEPYYTAIVVPLTVDGRLLLVERYRYPIGRWSIEFPRFDLDSSDAGWKGAAESDLFRQVGVTATKLTMLGATQIDPALLATTAIVILAEGCQAAASEPKRKKSAETGVPEYPCEELIASTVALPLTELYELVRQGEVSCNVTLAALTLYQAMLR